MEQPSHPPGLVTACRITISHQIHAGPSTATCQSYTGSLTGEHILKWMKICRLCCLWVFPFPNYYTIYIYMYIYIYVFKQLNMWKSIFHPKDPNMSTCPPRLHPENAARGPSGSYLTWGHFFTSHAMYGRCPVEGLCLGWSLMKWSRFNVRHPH